MRGRALFWIEEQFDNLGYARGFRLRKLDLEPWQTSFDGVSGE